MLIWIIISLLTTMDPLLRKRRMWIHKIDAIFFFLNAKIVNKKSCWFKNKKLCFYLFKNKKIDKKKRKKRDPILICLIYMCVWEKERIFSRLVDNLFDYFILLLGEVTRVFSLVAFWTYLRIWFLLRLNFDVFDC